MALEREYDIYFQNNHGMYALSSQLKYLDLIKVGKTKDILRLMRSVSDFKQQRKELAQEPEHHNHKTLVFDIQNAFVRKINLSDPQEIKLLKGSNNFEEFIVVNT